MGEGVIYLTNLNMININLKMVKLPFKFLMNHLIEPIFSQFRCIWNPKGFAPTKTPAGLNSLSAHFNYSLCM